jgi:hypothetical protein
MEYIFLPGAHMFTCRPSRRNVRGARCHVLADLDFVHLEVQDVSMTVRTESKRQQTKNTSADSMLQVFLRMSLWSRTRLSKKLPQPSSLFSCLLK